MRSFPRRARTVPPERRNMSMIFQSYAFMAAHDRAENVRLWLQIAQGRSRHAQTASSAPILRDHAICALAERYPGRASRSGQQQPGRTGTRTDRRARDAFADEPLSNLDANLREEMRFEVRRLHDEIRYTTVYVTHDSVRGDDHG